MEDLKTDFDENPLNHNQRLLTQNYDRENLGNHRSDIVSDENGHHIRENIVLSQEYVRK